MFDTTQILLVTVVTILTIILAVIGIQVVFILQEFRRMLERTSKIMEDAGRVTEGISTSFTGVSGILAGFKTGLTAVNVFHKKKNKTDE